MSLYHALFGENPFAHLLLELLGTTADKVPRYRDCFLSEDGTEIVIHTRTGGGNRDYYESEERSRRTTGEEGDIAGPWNSDLRNLPGFKGDADDDFDCTYANFRYEIPEPFRAQAALIRQLGAVADPAKRWQELFDALKAGDTSKPEVQRALAVSGKIAAAIKKADDDGSSGTIINV